MKSPRLPLRALVAKPPPGGEPDVGPCVAVDPVPVVIFTGIFRIVADAEPQRASADRVWMSLDIGI